MTPMTEAHDLPSGAGPDDADPVKTPIETYLSAVENLDAGEVTGPAVALADLLEARLEGADAPDARRVLDDLVSASRDESGGPAE